MKTKKMTDEKKIPVSNVWNNRVPTPWAASAMQNSAEYEELAKEIADRWEKAFADFTEEEEKK